MKASEIPPKMNKPFANAAGPAYIADIPDNSLIGTTGKAGRASFADGFPPVNFTPVTAGGIPPSGADHNGILYRITQWSRWAAAGGVARFDATFSGAVGGYPYGAILQSNVQQGVIWYSNKDDNTTDPETAGQTDWRLLVPTRSVNGRTGEITLNYNDIVNALSFTPVRQGGGARQLTNTVKIGWTSGNVAISIDNFDWGDVASQAWTISWTQNWVLGYLDYYNGATIIPQRNTYVQNLFQFAGVNGGYFWRANGVYFQMVSVELYSYRTSVFWPTAFPNLCTTVHCQEGNADGWGNNGYNGGPSGVPIFGSSNRDRFGTTIHAARIQNGQNDLIFPTGGGSQNCVILATGY